MSVVFEETVIPGARFGNWTALCYAGRDRVRRAMWVCRCQCSVVRPVRAYDLTTGMSTQCQSCGARHREAKKRQEREKEKA